MATLTTTKNTINLKLNNGTSATGSIRTINVSLGKISAEWTDSNEDYTKALAVANAVGNCLTKSIYQIERVAYGYIRN